MISVANIEWKQVDSINLSINLVSLHDYCKLTIANVTSEVYRIAYSCAVYKPNFDKNLQMSSIYPSTKFLNLVVLNRLHEIF